MWIFLITTGCCTHVYLVLWGDHRDGDHNHRVIWIGVSTLDGTPWVMGFGFPPARSIDIDRQRTNPQCLHSTGHLATWVAVGGYAAVGSQLAFLRSSPQQQNLQTRQLDVLCKYAWQESWRQPDPVYTCQRRHNNAAQVARSHISGKIQDITICCGILRHISGWCSLWNPTYSEE